MSGVKPYWGTEIAVEKIAGAPLRMYVDRPTRIECLLPFARNWGPRAYLVQGDHVVTFDELLRASARKARILAELGVTRGDHVFLIGWNGADWVLNFWACVRVGAVPILGNAWWSGEEIGESLRLLQPKLVLADARAAQRITCGWHVGPWDALELTLSSSATTGSEIDDTAPGDENEPAVIIFTSGTEGRAKAVVLAHRSLLAQLQMLLHVTHRLPYQPDAAAGEVCLHTGPLFHIGGVQALLRGVTLGNTLVMLRGRFDPAEALELIERFRVSRWNAVPTMASRLLEHPDVRRRNVSSLRTVTLGGSPVHSDLMGTLRNGLPGVLTRVATGYGLSENAGQATAAGGADTVERPGSSGRALPCVELRILPSAAGSNGEILVRSPTQMLRYFGEEQSPIDAEGWLHTGDLGYLEDNGHLWITGRSKDLIIRGGENISPAAVEHALASLPGVVEAAVFGMPDPDVGEEVVAVVVVIGGETQAKLAAELRKKVASFAIPTRWRLQRERLPINQTGKIDKPALIAMMRAEIVGELGQDKAG